MKKLSKVTYLFGNGSQSIDVIVFETVGLLVGWLLSTIHFAITHKSGTTGKLFQVGIVNWEVCVILLQYPDSSSLYGKLSDCIWTRFAVGGTNDFDVKPAMFHVEFRGRHLVENYGSVESREDGKASFRKKEGAMTALFLPQIGCFWPWELCYESTQGYFRLFETLFT